MSQKYKVKNKGKRNLTMAHTLLDEKKIRFAPGSSKTLNVNQYNSILPSIRAFPNEITVSEIKVETKDQEELVEVPVIEGLIKPEDFKTRKEIVAFGKANDVELDMAFYTTMSALCDQYNKIKFADDFSEDEGLSGTSE